MHLVPPAIGLLRELSPEVPPEIRDQLMLGEPPEHLQPPHHPVAVLMRKYWKLRDCNRSKTARQLGEGGNESKTLRRIDQILNGERLLPEWISRLSSHLEIPETELTAAQIEAAAWEKQLDTFHLHRSRHRLYNRFGPYLRPLPPCDTPPTVPCAPPRLRIDDLLEVHEDPTPDAVVPWLQSHTHHLIKGQAPIAGWLYHRAPEELYFFTAHGSHLTSGEADLPTPPQMNDPHVPLWRERP